LSDIVLTPDIKAISETKLNNNIRLIIMTYNYLDILSLIKIP